MRREDSWSYVSLFSLKDRLGKWMPKQWVEPAPRKDAYLFDPENYRWRRKSDGTIVEGDPMGIMTDPVWR